MTKSRTELLAKLAQYNGGVVEPDWEKWPSYKILIELDKLRKESELPDVSTASRFLNLREYSS